MHVLNHKIAENHMIGIKLHSGIYLEKLYNL